MLQQRHPWGRIPKTPSHEQKGAPGEDFMAALLMGGPLGENEMGTSTEREATDQMSRTSLDGLKGILLRKKSQHRNTMRTTYRLHKLNLYACRGNTQFAKNLGKQHSHRKYI